MRFARLLNLLFAACLSERSRQQCENQLGCSTSQPNALSYSTAYTADVFEGMRWFNPSLFDEIDVKSWLFRSAQDNAIKPHLLRVCKQIYCEATPIFYSSAFIDIVVTSTVLTPNSLKYIINRLDLIARPRPYNFKSVLVCLHCDGGPIDLIRCRQHRDASIIGHYADIMSRQCGTLDMLHVQMVD
jgi:hypothetical protein